jgi:thiosulfate/3-mercaptopyruvate sulfurtransferase
MNQQSVLPLIVEPDELETKLTNENIQVVDLCKPDTYIQGHVPGAVHLDYAKLIRQQLPAKGLLPTEQNISEVLSAIGISPDTHVVAYDDEGGGKACRLLFTLDAIGHQHFSLLNGGLPAWANDGHALDKNIPTVEPTHYKAHYVNANVIADKQYILDHLQDSNVDILDCRTPEEYSGEKKYADRAGHIPGAVNMEWVLAMDQQRNLRFKSQAELTNLLDARGVTPSKEIIVYCQTHHRSAHSYIVLKSLGFSKIRGYAGSWSEWGNSAEVPVES